LIDDVKLIGTSEENNLDQHSYDHAMDAYMFKNVDLMGYDSAELSYWYWLDDSDGHYDYLEVGYRIGSTWTYPNKHINGSSNWVQSSISIPTDSNAVGFLWHSSESINAYDEGAYVDDVTLTATSVPDFSLRGKQAWYWTGNTQIRSVATGDVDGDTNMEIVTAGYYYDGSRNVAQLVTWDGATGVLEDITTWYWTSHTHIYSVAVGDVDGDTNLEIVTGGSYHDGTRDIAQLCVWDGATLTVEDTQTWYWTDDTYIYSVAVGDVDGDSQVEIVTGGRFYDGARHNAQLCVWDGATLTLEDTQTWYWTGSTEIESVVVGDVDGDTQMEIVTGGCYYDGTRNNAQLCVWNGADLTLEDITTWYWTSHTLVESIAVGDVDGDTNLEIVTGGHFWDGSRYVAQLVAWNGADLTFEDGATWYWIGSTYIQSVVIDDFDGDTQMEVMTGGWYNDGTREVAQLVAWNGADLSYENVNTWYWTSDTGIYCVASGDMVLDSKPEIVTGGYFNDGTRKNAQLCLWGYS
jgi:hypothetical protein